MFCPCVVTSSAQREGTELVQQELWRSSILDAICFEKLCKIVAENLQPDQETDIVDYLHVCKM
jgi:hypothetical protein